MKAYLRQKTTQWSRLYMWSTKLVLALALVGFTVNIAKVVLCWFCCFTSYPLSLNLVFMPPPVCNTVLNGCNFSLAMELAYIAVSNKLFIKEEIESSISETKVNDNDDIYLLKWFSFNSFLFYVVLFFFLFNLLSDQHAHIFFQVNNHFNNQHSRVVKVNNCSQLNSNPIKKFQMCSEQTSLFLHSETLTHYLISDEHNCFLLFHCLCF